MECGINNRLRKYIKNGIVRTLLMAIIAVNISSFAVVGLTLTDTTASEVYAAESYNSVEDYLKSEGFTVCSSESVAYSIISSYAATPYDDTTIYYDADGNYIYDEDGDLMRTANAHLIAYKGDYSSRIEALERSADEDDSDYNIFYSYADFFPLKIYKDELAGYTLYAYYQYAYEYHSLGLTLDEAKYGMYAAQYAASQNTGTTVLEKIRYVYDYVCNRCTYDTSYVKGSIYDATTGSGLTVCSGYAELFQLIMEYCGLKSYLAVGIVPEGAHAWNIVEVDGELYYIDTTFADTSGDYDNYFLFGTNERPDYYGIGIASHSYNGQTEKVASTEGVQTGNTQATVSQEQATSAAAKAEEVVAKVVEEVVIVPTEASTATENTTASSTTGNISATGNSTSNQTAAGNGVDSLGSHVDAAGDAVIDELNQETASQTAKVTTSDSNTREDLTASDFPTLIAINDTSNTLSLDNSENTDALIDTQQSNIYIIIIVIAGLVMLASVIIAIGVMKKR